MYAHAHTLTPTKPPKVQALISQTRFGCETRYPRRILGSRSTLIMAGMRVRVNGLVESPQWNEQEGTVLNELANGRVCVQLDAGKELSLKWHSLVIVPGKDSDEEGDSRSAATAACAFPQCPQGAGGKGQEKPFKRCARCRRVVYCSTDCAKGDWASHKKTCVAVDPDYEAYPRETLEKVHPFDDSPVASDFFLWSKPDRAKPKSLAR